MWTKVRGEDLPSAQQTLQSGPARYISKQHYLTATCTGPQVPQLSSFISMQNKA